MEDFHESMELVLSWPVGTNKYVHLDNGIEITEQIAAKVPLDGPNCGANRTYTDCQNYTLVMFSGNDVGDQRATYIIGNIPGKEGVPGGSVKLKYVPPKYFAGYTHFAALLEMSHFIPRFHSDDVPPYDCTLNKGTTLKADPRCNKDAVIWPSCSPMKFIHDDMCIAWKDLPKHEERNNFNLKLFAESNGLTIVDIKWYTVREPNAGVANAEKVATAATSTLLGVEVPSPTSDETALPDVAEEEPRAVRSGNDDDEMVCNEGHAERKLPPLLTSA